jgi:tyrosine-protein phosphatase SIW14
MLRSILSLGLVLVLVSAGCQTVGKSMPGLSNFDTVEAGAAGVYRGAQPTREGIASLHQQGVRTIIDLRDDPEDYEKQDAEACGMHYVSIKSDASNVEPATIRAFLDTLATAPRPIFVHCQFGRDRTGLEIAVYRIVAAGWSREMAIADLHAHGFNWFLYPNIVRYLRSFDVAQFPIKRPPVETASSGQNIKVGG